MLRRRERALCGMQQLRDPVAQADAVRDMAQSLAVSVDLLPELAVLLHEGETLVLVAFCVRLLLEHVEQLVAVVRARGDRARHLVGLDDAQQRG